jgi:hypothetical protein
MKMLSLPLLDKVIGVYSWSPDCLDALGTLGRDPDRYRTTLSALEACLDRSELDTPNQECRQALGGPALALYQEIVMSAPLYQLFRQEPRYSTQSPFDVATLARFADVRPNSATILETRDPSFMRILPFVSSTGMVTAQRILQDDLTRLVLIWTTAPQLAERLHEIAQTDRWAEQLVALEFKVERLQDQGRDVTGLIEPARRALEMITAEVDDPGAPLRKLLLDAPRFSTLLPEEILAFWKVRDVLPSADDLLSQQLGPATAWEKAQRVAAEILSKNLLRAEDREALARSLGFRIEAAGYFLELRRFTKVDALRYRWPELYQLLQEDRSSLIALEGQAIQPQPELVELLKRWERFMKDEQLVRFFNLRPLFRDIYPDDLKKYEKAAKSVSATAEKTPAPEGLSIAGLVGDAIGTSYDEIMISQEKVESAEGVYTIRIESDAGKEEEQISIDWASLKSEVVAQVPAAVTRELAPARAMDLSEQVRNLGMQTYDLIFKRKVRQHFEERLKTGDAYRVFIEMSSNDSNIMSIPWETLYLSRFRTFLALTRKYSLIRYLPNESPLPSRPFLPPLRLLVVLASPTDQPPIQIDQEAEILRRALATHEEQGLVKPLFLSRGDANLLNFQRTIRLFSPHILHFTGHGHFDARTGPGKGVLVFQDGDVSQFVEAEAVATLLHDSEISIAVLNGCHTGQASSDVFSGVAGSLVGAGIPAVVATMRAIDDRAALLFAREFYRSLVDGFALEAALIEARKALSVEKWDWSAYALFTSSKQGLEPLRMINQPARKVPSRDDR